ncbi:hypothetical protein O181_039214 [Austropuccinia psidii MF-1]|uniref:Uncharacterized protein n=1 Tax=Austropuccinia psidii MF-1 TaxID=1389203 RepID=A0A9Q3DA02_9BASI|nr:hypothetical protein [Austropuccinia psidii MF-1]
MKPQPQGPALSNPYQYGIQKDIVLDNKPRSPSQYQDGYKMSYQEKEYVKQLPEDSSWPKLSGVAEYDHMKCIDYIDGHLFYLPSIPDYWIAARLNTAFKVHASIWDT